MDLAIQFGIKSSFKVLYKVFKPLQSILMPLHFAALKQDMPTQIR